MKKISKEFPNDVPLYYASWNSPFGKIVVCCSDKGLNQIELCPLPERASGVKSRVAKRMIPAGNSRQPGACWVRQTIAELREYAAGKRKEFTVPLDLEGTPFQRKVWKALLGIPYGETRSYQQIARVAGNARASRAVGMANHWNPVAIVVPCHRVIACDGTLGGYAGGLKLKEEILRMEGALH